MSSDLKVYPSNRSNRSKPSNRSKRSEPSSHRIEVIPVATVATTAAATAVAATATPPAVTPDLYLVLISRWNSIGSGNKHAEETIKSARLYHAAIRTKLSEGQLMNPIISTAFYDCYWTNCSTSAFVDYNKRLQ